MQPTGAHDTSLPDKIREGLERLAAVLRADQWSASGAVGVNPAQTSVLAYLAGRAKAGSRVKGVAAHLGVTQPSATDTIAALEGRGLVTKSGDAVDARAVIIEITSKGRELVKAAARVPSASIDALSVLTLPEQTDLYLLVVKLIRQLQLAGAIPMQRMCMSCSHFLPNHHLGGARPHHCAFINAAIGTSDLRLDCADHQAASPEEQALRWKSFQGANAANNQPNSTTKETNP